MATSIHHGKPGSFKSFTLVQRFAIDALREGRVVVTNIRGLTSLQRILDQFPDYVFPDSSDLIFINTETAEGRAVMAGWFHWVPFGALILMDEGQRIYPDRRDFKLESLDNHISPVGYQIIDINVVIIDDYTKQTYSIGRPEDVFTAFDMQRHYQWDVFISTTHINKIQKPIREVSETAFLHKSLSGKLPFLFKNTWYEFQHDPSTTGESLSHRIGKPRKYKADPRVFACYQSTVTGQHTESKADQNILGDPGVRFKLLAIVLSIGASIYYFFHFAAAHEAIKVPSAAGVPPVQQVDVAVLPADKVHNPAPVGNTINHVSAEQIVNLTADLGYKLLIVSYQNSRRNDLTRFIVDTKDGLRNVDIQQLSRAGFTVFFRGLCDISIVSKDRHTQKIGCDSPYISHCAVKVKSSDIISFRDCKKYGSDEKTTTKQPNNAIVAAATTTLVDTGQ